jgi:hypothetical protein
MSDIPDHAQVDITAASATVSQAGFGLPLLVSHGTWPGAGSELTREYSKQSDVEVDWAANTPERLAAAAIFGQSPRPPKVVIGRGAAKPTQQFEFTPVVINNYTYKLEINGLTAQYVSDGTATAAEITAGLKAAVDALALAVTTSQQAGNTVLRIVANVAGVWFRVKCLDRPNLPVLQNHADPGMGTNLSNIALERNDWYAIHTAFNSKLYIEAVALYANSNKKLYGAQTIDTAVPQTPNSGTDDVGESLKSLAYNYAFTFYSPGVADFVDAGVFGARLPKLPGGETWKFAQLSGVPATSYTGTEIANMKAKNVNFFNPCAGVNITEPGVLASGRFIDFQRYLDYLVARIGERIYRVQVTNDKVPFTDDGIALIAAEVEGQLQSDAKRNPPVQQPAIDKDSIVVTVPKALDVAQADRDARQLPGVDFSARYTGAIHKAIITGRVTV